MYAAENASQDMELLKWDSALLWSSLSPWQYSSTWFPSFASGPTKNMVLIGEIDQPLPSNSYYLNSVNTRLCQTSIITDTIMRKKSLKRYRLVIN